MFGSQNDLLVLPETNDISNRNDADVSKAGRISLVIGFFLWIFFIPGDHFFLATEMQKKLIKRIFNGIID